MTVSQTEPIQKLQDFAEKNQQTQGKFTIGDEKVSAALLGIVPADGSVASQCVYARPRKSLIHSDGLPRMLMVLQDPEIQKATGKTKPVDVMTALREMKNSM